MGSARQLFFSSDADSDFPTQQIHPLNAPSDSPIYPCTHQILDTWRIVKVSCQMGAGRTSKWLRSNSPSSQH